MKKVLAICAVVTVMLAVIGTANATFVAPSASNPMTFEGNVDLTFPYYPDLTGTQTGTLAGVGDASAYSFVISSVNPGPGGDDIVVSWAIEDSSSTTLLAGTMENFSFWDENGNIPSGTSGSVFSYADYVSNDGSGWVGQGDSTGSWLGTYDATPTWTGSVVVTPEPATLCLLGLGGLMLRRRKKA